MNRTVGAMVVAVAAGCKPAPQTDTRWPGETAVPEPSGCPAPAAALRRWQVGDDADADVVPGGPALVLMGGGADVDAAFAWWRTPLAGGDVVVLRTSGSDGYDDYLYADIGGADSVETLLVDSAALADDPYVACRVRAAEGVFLAGGDQSTYMALWGGRALVSAVGDAWARGAVVGGTSAGLAVLGAFVYSARRGSVTSAEALADPYHRAVTLDDALFHPPLLPGVITDSHFHERDRMGRLVAFLARLVADGRAVDVTGLALDEGTAVVVDAAGVGTVLGAGRVYVLESAGPPATCAPRTALSYRGLSLTALAAGDTLSFPSLGSAVPSRTLSAVDGALDPSDPY